MNENSIVRMAMKYNWVAMERFEPLSVRSFGLVLLVAKLSVTYRIGMV